MAKQPNGGRGRGGYSKRGGVSQTLNNPLDDIAQVEQVLGSGNEDPLLANLSAAPLQDVAAPRLEGDAEKEQENVLRPQGLGEFQGQSKLKEELGVYIKAAKMRGEPLDHTFLIGPPGLGKTTLASIIAHEMGAEIKMTTAPALEKPKDLAGILTNVTENSVFFIDEIHRLRPALGEMLYTAMEDYEIDWVIGQGPAARTMRIPIPKFTLIGATTKAGGVATPLAERFGIQLHLNYYTDEELADVIRRSAKILSVRIVPEAVSLLAHCSRGTPRIANRYLRRIRDYAAVLQDGTVTAAIVQQGLDGMGVDHNGLTREDRRLLELVIDYYHGGPVGLQTIAVAMGEEEASISDYYEPYLIQKGYLQRTPSGRVVTSKAYALFGKKDQRQPQGGTNADQGFLF